jgi:hypothetical protein
VSHGGVGVGKAKISDVGTGVGEIRSSILSPGPDPVARRDHAGSVNYPPLTYLITDGVGLPRKFRPLFWPTFRHPSL